MENKLKPNFTQIPNVFFDEWLSELEKGELKVLLYVMRRTYGFQKDKDKISFSQLQRGIKNLDNGTGLGRETLARSIATLEERGLLVVVRENMTNTYSLNINYATSTTIELVPQSNRTSTTIEPQLVPQSNLQKKVSKESIQKKDIYTPEILSYWNSKDIITHTERSDIKSVIEKTLKTNSVENIKKAIDNYSNIYHSPETYFKHKWTLAEFLTRKNALPVFMDKGIDDYRKNKSEIINETIFIN